MMVFDPRGHFFLSVLCALLGIVISILAGTPVGSTIVAADAAAFGICYAAGMMMGGARRGKDRQVLFCLHHSGRDGLLRAGHRV